MKDIICTPFLMVVGVDGHKSHSLCRIQSQIVELMFRHFTNKFMHIQVISLERHNTDNRFRHYKNYIFVS